MFARFLMLALIVAVGWAAIARASTAAGPEQTYVVRAGDTLWSIALQRYGGDPREGVWLLRQRNGLRGAAIQPGQPLVLP